jgi:hypothetical protein
MALILNIPLEEEVRGLLEMGMGSGQMMPLVCRGPSDEATARRLRGAKAEGLFPDAVSPEGALAGLWLRFSCFEECHGVAQDLATAEGSYWHAILHRQEPDDWNAGYWFKRVGRHAIFEALAEEAGRLSASYPGAEALDTAQWVPERFIRYCAKARETPGSETEALARAIQEAEWRLLFCWCARVRG